MRIEPLKPKLITYLAKRGLIKKFNKQIALFISDPKHPSLNTELLLPKEYKVYSFRIDRKYRAIFIFKAIDGIEIVDINDHYR